MKRRKLVIILDNPSWNMGGPNLNHEGAGGSILKFTLKRLSIPRDAWVHLWVYPEREIRDIPSKKAAREKFLAPHINKLEEEILLHSPSVLVGLGRLACEFLTGTPVLKNKAGTCWSNRRLSDKKVWIGYSPVATLFDPNLYVDVTGVIANACQRAGIPTHFDPNVPIFDWSPYMKATT